MPGRVTNIAVGAFFICTSLTAITADADNSTHGSVDGGMFNKSQTALQPQVQTTDASFGVRTNQFGFNIIRAVGRVVVVEACTDLPNISGGNRHTHRWLVLLQ